MIEANGGWKLGIVGRSFHALNKVGHSRGWQRSINKRTKHKPNSQLHDMTPGLFLTVTGSGSSSSMHEHEPFY